MIAAESKKKQADANYTKVKSDQDKAVVDATASASTEEEKIKKQQQQAKDDDAASEDKSTENETTIEDKPQTA